MNKIIPVKWHVLASIAALALIALYLSSILDTYILHAFIEVLNIVLAFSIFTITWNARRFQNNSYLTFIGVAFLFITGLIIFHELRVVSTMRVFPYYEFRELTIEKVLSRYIMGFSFLFAPLFFHRKLKISAIFLIYGGLLMLLLAPVFYWRLSPESLLLEDGFTSLGLVNEYTVLFLLLGAAAQLLRYRKELDRNILRLLVISISVAIASRIVFSTNSEQSIPLFLTGQFLQLMSFYLFYAAFVETGLARPYNLLFHDLMQSKEAVASHAKELARSNRELEQEIGERKQIEDKLTASEGALKSQWDMLIAMMDTMENGVYISNSDYDIEYINPSIARRRGTALGRKCYEYFHGGTGVCAWCRNMEVFDSKTTRWEWQSDISGRTYDIISMPIRNARGTISRLTLMQNITEKKQAISQIQLQSRILSSVKDAVIVLDERLRIATWNCAAETVFGWKEDEVQGKTVTEVLPHMFFNSDVAENLRTQFFEYRKDGTPVSLDSSFFVVHNQQEQITGYVGLLRDVTEHVRSEEALRKSEELYRNFSSHLESAREKERQFIAREIHDEFGQILTALKWDLCLLSGDGVEVNKDRAAKSMSGLIDSAMASIQNVTERLRPTQLDNLGLGPAIEWHTAQFQKRTRINCILNLDGINSVHGDPAIAVFRILQECLTNIARHSQATGVDLSFKKDEDKFVFTVRDNGKGITEAQKADMKSFGLMGMRERARSCGGEIEISGIEGKGTVVRLSLPAAEMEKV